MKTHTIEKMFTTYSSKLGDDLFPEKTFFEIEAAHFVSELFVRHAGNIDSPQAFLTLLDTFIPEIIQDTLDNPSWSTESTVSRWEMTKAMIRQRIMQRFPSYFDDKDSNSKPMTDDTRLGLSYDHITKSTEAYIKLCIERSTKPDCPNQKAELNRARGALEHWRCLAVDIAAPEKIIDADELRMITLIFYS